LLVPNAACREGGVLLACTKSSFRVANFKYYTYAYCGIEKYIIIARVVSCGAPSNCASFDLRAKGASFDLRAKGASFDLRAELATRTVHTMSLTHYATELCCL
jgi:hypothetical protein